DLLKLDIEGGEYEVIEDVLTSGVSVDQVVVEFHPHIANVVHHGTMLGVHGWRQTERTLTALHRAGYRIFASSRRGTEISLVRA
ncbi:MAG: FkbM family methyltransferase, partial [Chloroflexi bacterium]|nr:FkbM family methyltransferase [Chloroflexota bacterium]